MNNDFTERQTNGKVFMLTDLGNDIVKIFHKPL